MLRPLFLSLALAALAGTAAADAPRADAAADGAFLGACLGVHLPGGTAAAEQRCVGIIALSCMNGESGGTTLGQSTCLMREAAGWEVVLDAAWSDLSTRAETASAEGAEALRRAQAAWRGFADAECRYAYAIWGEGSFRQVAGADCRLNTVARRAIQLRAQTQPES